MKHAEIFGRFARRRIFLIALFVWSILLLQIWFLPQIGHYEGTRYSPRTAAILFSASFLIMGCASLLYLWWLVSALRNIDAVFESDGSLFYFDKFRKRAELSLVKNALFLKNRHSIGGRVVMNMKSGETLSFSTRILQEEGEVIAERINARIALLS